MILCDTNILIEFYKNTQRVVQELRHIGQNRLAVSAVTLAELYFGALNKSELQRVSYPAINGGACQKALELTSLSTLSATLEENLGTVECFTSSTLYG